MHDCTFKSLSAKVIVLMLLMFLSNWCFQGVEKGYIGNKWVKPRAYNGNAYSHYLSILIKTFICENFCSHCIVLLRYLNRVNVMHFITFVWNAKSFKISCVLFLLLVTLQALSWILENSEQKIILQTIDQLIPFSQLFGSISFTVYSFSSKGEFLRGYLIRYHLHIIKTDIK